MSVGLRRQIALSTAHGVVLALGLMFAACGSSAEPEESSDSNSTTTIPVVGNYPASGGAGQASSSDGFKGWRSDAAGSSAAAGKAAAAGSSGASASAGSSGSAAGSGGSAGSVSTAGASAAAGAGATAGSDAAAEDDPLDLFGPGSGTTSCEGLICVEDQDCKDLYPEESATCKFSRCVDFTCK